MRFSKRILYVSFLAFLVLLGALYLRGGKAADEDRKEAGKTSVKQMQALYSGDLKNASPEKRIVRLDEKNLKELGIITGKAESGRIEVEVSAPGEVKINADHLVHIVPRASGVVREIRKNLGDAVCAGDVLAILESRELAEASLEYLSARERVALTKAAFERNEFLREKNISSESDYLSAKQVFTESGISMAEARQKLLTLGLTEDKINGLSLQDSGDLSRYALIAPIGGTVIEKNVSLGMVLKEDAEAFTVADLGTVWIDLSIHQKDLGAVRVGQEARVEAGRGIPEFRGKISYLDPVVGEQTRATLARMVAPNPGGLLRPGLFVTGKIAVDTAEAAVRVLPSALALIGDQTCVFVREGGVFMPRAVIIGRNDKNGAEVTAGLEPGEEYAITGVFSLKAELSKGSFGGDDD